jgi:S1-C subfamily serine protease
VGAGDYRYKGKAFITDANNNPGSYGGPILNASGDWVGLTGRIVSSNATNTQINYGVPVNELKDFLAVALARKEAAPDEDFVRPTKGPVKAVVAGYHGIHLFDQGGQLPPPFVDRLDRKSPAKAAGLREDDLIQYVNGKLVQTCPQFEAAMAALPAGAEVRLTALRGRQTKTPTEIVFKLEEPKK